MLTDSFLREFLGGDIQQRVTNLETAMQAFRNHDWPGNVRELRNIIELAACSGQEPIDLTAFLYLGSTRRQDSSQPRFSADRPFKIVKQELIQDFEVQYITDLLERHNGNVSQAAKQAGIERTYLQRLVSKYELR